MTLELCAKIAGTNKINNELKSFRIKDGTVVATDLISTIKVENLPFTSVDCLVDAESFMKAYKVTKQPKVTTEKNLLTIEEGKFSASINLFDSIGYPTITKPDGKSIEPGNFISALKAVLPFAKADHVHFFFDEEYVYVTDTAFLVRSAAKVFPKGDIFSIPKYFAEYVVQVDKDPISIIYDDSTISVMFEETWLQSARTPSVVNVAEPFAKFNTYTFEALPEDVLSAMKGMVNKVGDKDIVMFSPMGITLMQQGVMQWHIKHPCETFKFSAPNLKVLLANATTFSFEGKNEEGNVDKIMFKGKDVEGIWMAVETRNA